MSVVIYAISLFLTSLSFLLCQDDFSGLPMFRVIILMLSWYPKYNVICTKHSVQCYTCQCQIFHQDIIFVWQQSIQSGFTDVHKSCKMSTAASGSLVKKPRKPTCRLAWSSFFHVLLFIITLQRTFLRPFSGLSAILIRFPTFLTIDHFSDPFPTSPTYLDTLYQQHMCQY